MANPHMKLKLASVEVVQAPNVPSALTGQMPIEFEK
jgi:hypothetical protein